MEKQSSRLFFLRNILYIVLLFNNIVNIVTVWDFKYQNKIYSAILYSLYPIIVMVVILNSML